MADVVAGVVRDPDPRVAAEPGADRRALAGQVQGHRPARQLRGLPEGVLLPRGRRHEQTRQV